MDDAFARRSDPETSRAAADAVEATKLEHRVVEALRVHGPSTTHELAERTGIPLWSLSPRIRPLVDKGLVSDSGVTRKGSSGRQSIVWQAGGTPKAEKPVMKVTGTAKFTAQDRLDAAKRELAMREGVYPRWVTENRMTQKKATHEIEVMRAIVGDYEKLAAGERLI